MSVLAMLLAAVVVPPVPIDPGTWIGPEDYPKAALREERGGQIGFRLTISADGRSTRCEIARSSGYQDLDERTCSLLMKRARFRPALDASGQAVFSVYRNINNFSIPGRVTFPKTLRQDVAVTMPALPASVEGPVVVEVAFAVDVTGRLSDCGPVPAIRPSRSQQKAEEVLGPSACARALTDWRPMPALDDAGNPMASVQTARILFATEALPPR